MINVKEELEAHISDRSVKCIMIILDDNYPPIYLSEGYIELDYYDFIESINFNYGDGYRIQHIYGTIWYSDGTWSERCEYDGSECWDYKECPEIPDSLKFQNY